MTLDVLNKSSSLVPRYTGPPPHPRTPNTTLNQPLLPAPPLAQVLIKAVPRLDMTRLSMTRADRKAHGPFPRPPQKYFNPMEVTEATRRSGDGRVEAGMVPYVAGMRGHKFGGNWYAQGFLYKSISIDRVVRCSSCSDNEQAIVLSGRP